MNKFKLTTFLTLSVFAFVSLLFLASKSVFACNQGDYKTVCVHPGQERVYECEDNGDGTFSWGVAYPQANPDCMREAPPEVQDEKNYNPDKPPAGAEQDKTNDCLTGKASSDQCGFKKGTPEYDAAEAARLRLDVNSRLPKVCSPGDFYTSCSGPDAEDVWSCTADGKGWTRKNRQTNVNCKEIAKCDPVTKKCTGDQVFNPAAQEGAALQTKAKIRTSGCWVVGNNTQAGGDTACGVAYGGMSQCDQKSGQCKAPGGAPGQAACTSTVPCPYGGGCTMNSQCIDNTCNLNSGAKSGVCVPKAAAKAVGTCPGGKDTECPTGSYCSGKSCVAKRTGGNCCSSANSDINTCVSGKKCAIVADNTCVSGASCEQLNTKKAGEPCDNEGECAVGAKCVAPAGGALNAQKECTAAAPVPSVTYSTCVAGCEPRDQQCKLDCKSNYPGTAPTTTQSYPTCVAGCEQGSNGAQCRADCAVRAGSGSGSSGSSTTPGAAVLPPTANASACALCLMNDDRVACEPVCGSATPVVPPAIAAAPAVPTTPEQKNCMTKCVREDGEPWNVCLSACFPQLPKLDLPIGSLANGDACSRELIAGTVKSNLNPYCQSGRCGDGDTCEAANLPGGDIAGAATRESLKLVCKAMGFDGDTCDKASATVGDTVKNKISSTPAPVLLMQAGSLPPKSGCWGPSPVNLYCSSGMCFDGECGEPVNPAKAMTYLGCRVGGGSDADCKAARGAVTTGDITVPKSQPQYIPVVTPGTLGGDCSQPCGSGMYCSALLSRCVIDFGIWK